MDSRALEVLHQEILCILAEYSLNLGAREKLSQAQADQIVEFISQYERADEFIKSHNLYLVKVASRKY